MRSIGFIALFFASQTVALTQTWTAFVPGGSADSFNGKIATDRFGNVYTATSAGLNNQIVISTFDAAGTLLSTFMSPALVGQVRAVAVHPNGTVFVAGSLIGQGFAAGVSNGKVSSYTAFGIASGLTAVNALAIDDAGDLYLGGYTNFPGFPITSGAFQTSGPKATGFTTAVFGFVVKLSAVNLQTIFSTFYGGSSTRCLRGDCIGGAGSTSVASIAPFSDGTVTIGGSTGATDLPVTPGSFQTACNCSFEHSTGFVANLSKDGKTLNWATYFGGNGSSAGYSEPVLGVSEAANHDVIVSGAESTGNFPVTPGFLSTRLNETIYHPYVARFDPRVTKLLYSIVIGGSGTDKPVAAIVGTGGQIVIAGTTLSPDFPLLPNSLTSGSSFVVGISAEGTTETSSYRLPSGLADFGIATAPDGSVLLLGSAGSVTRIGPAGVGETSLLGVANALGTKVAQVLAPGEIVSLYGSGLAVSTTTAPLSQSHLPASLGGISVEIGGIASPLLYVSPTQINAVVPFGVAVPSRLSVRVTGNGKQTVVAGFSAVPAAPSAVPVVLNQDGTVNSKAAPAPAGSVVTLFLSGAGKLAGLEDDGLITNSLFPPALPITANLVGKGPVSLQYSGSAPGLVSGVLQANVVIPGDTLPALYGIQILVDSTYMTDAVSVYVGSS